MRIRTKAEFIANIAPGDCLGIRRDGAYLNVSMLLEYISHDYTFEHLRDLSGLSKDTKHQYLYNPENSKSNVTWHKLSPLEILLFCGGLGEV